MPGKHETLLGKWQTLPRLFGLKANICALISRLYSSCLNVPSVCGMHKIAKCRLYTAGKSHKWKTRSRLLKASKKIKRSRPEKFSESNSVRRVAYVASVGLLIDVRIASVSNSSVLKYFNPKIKHDIERSLRLSLFYFVCIHEYGWTVIYDILYGLRLLVREDGKWYP